MVEHDEGPAAEIAVAGSGRRRAPAAVPDDAEQYAVRAADGTLLATDVFLPRGAGPWPTLLTRLPYDKDGAECFLPTVARWFRSRGYAVVLQDVRGKVRSGGATEPFVAEEVDGAATLDWIVARPWSDGTVAMFGDSYYGWTQWAAAASRHPALRAIAPRVCGTDMRMQLGRGGVFALEMMASWVLETWVDDALYDYEGRLDWTVRPLSEILPRHLGRGAPILDRWAAGRFAPQAEASPRGDLPVLHLGGVFDFLLREQIATWRAAREHATAPQELVIDTVDHGSTPLREPGTPWRDPMGSTRSREEFLEGYLAAPLAFFDRHLRGRETRDAPPVRYRIAGAGPAWHEAESWPPARARAASFFPAGDPHTGFGTLDEQPGAEPRTVTWTHDPADPVPSAVHPYFTLVDPPDEQFTHGRSDVLVFQTPPVDHPVDLVGPLSLAAEVSGAAADAHVVATLCDVLPSGATVRIADGPVRACAPWPARVEIDLGHTSYRIRSGHRLRLTVAGSCFPRYSVHPGTDDDPWTTTNARPAQQSITLGGGRTVLSAFVLDGRQGR